MTQRTSMEKCLNVVLSDDKCTAYLEYYSEEEGYSFTTEELEQFVESKGIKHGLFARSVIGFCE